MKKPNKPYKGRKRKITKPALQAPFRRAGYLAALLNVTEPTIYRWARKFDFPRHPIGRRGDKPLFVWFIYDEIRPILVANGYANVPLTDEIK